MALTKWQQHRLDKVIEKVYQNTSDKPGYVYNTSATARLRLRRYGNDPAVARQTLADAFDAVGLGYLTISPGIVCWYRGRRVLKCGIRGDILNTRKMAQLMRAMELASIGEWKGIA
jgi:hypothetical protein